MTQSPDNQRIIKRLTSGIALLLTGIMLTSGCRNSPDQLEATTTERPTVPRVVYEIFVRSFADSDGDGLGDINGIIAKLDYIQELGAEAIWLTPVSKSPSYHKYDVTDYRSIDPEVGTMEDYKRLIVEAHKRGIAVIKDLVVNHTSDQHPWFQEAKKGKNNRYRAYYNWMTPRKIDSLGIATREKTGDSWEINPWHLASPQDDEKYYGLFWGGMPDLNFDNPEVREEIYRIGEFWLKEVGVDGFRLDAAKHIYPDWEADKSVAFWQEFEDRMKSVKPEVYLIGEVWTTPDKVAPYFKGLQANFNIDMGLGIQEMLRTGHDHGLAQKLVNSYALYGNVNRDFIDAPILGNHDQDRIGSIVGGHADKLKLAAAILLTLPGQPYLYYGEEIGMLGKKPDELIREPFLWQNGARDNYRTHWQKSHYSTDAAVQNLETQLADPNSLVNRYKNLIAFRKSEPALAQVTPANISESGIQQSGIFSFKRPHKSGDVLVMHNITGGDITFDLPSATGSKVLFTTHDSAQLIENRVKIPAYSTLVLKTKD